MIRGIIFPTQDTMRTGRDAACDFGQMGSHGIGVDGGQDQTGHCPSRRADGSEQISPLIARIARSAGPCSAPGPDSRQRALRPNPCFILEPDLDGLALSCLRDRSLYSRAEVFLKASCASGSVLGCCGRTESLR